MAYTPGLTKSQIYSVTSGQSVQIDNGITLAILNSTGLLAALTVTFPLKPQDGQPLSIIAPRGVTLLTMTLPSGQSVSGTLPALAAANQAMRYKFASTNMTWYPN